MSTAIQQKIFSLGSYGIATTDFLKQFFPESGPETYTFKGIEYMYLASGGSRDVYVDPSLDHVIKVPQDSMSYHSGNYYNAIEVYDYLENLHTIKKVPSVRTEYAGWDGDKLIIKQDFLIVMNTSRVRINPLFSEVFKPEWSSINEIYGFQYGWNRKTRQIELYDTADGYMRGDFIDWKFNSSFRFDKSGYKCFNYARMTRKIDYHNKFIAHLKKLNLYDEVLSYSTRPWCYLKHQDGILVYVNADDSGDDEYFIELCGDAITHFDGILDSAISSFMKGYEFDINTINNI